MQLMAGDDLKLMDGDATLCVATSHVELWHGRPAKSEEEMTDVLRAIDCALAEHGLTALLIDSRDSAYSAGSEQDRMWSWLQAHRTLERVAAVIESANLVASVNLTGLAKGIRIKAFDDADAARHWLAAT